MSRCGNEFDTWGALMYECDDVVCVGGMVLHVLIF